MIERLWLRNFKSFGEARLDLLPLTIVVGGNASGKSNLVGAFRFLHDLIHHGLEEATARGGGARALANALLSEAQFSIGARWRGSPVELPFVQASLQSYGLERLAWAEYEGTFSAAHDQLSAEPQRERLEMRFIPTQSGDEKPLLRVLIQKDGDKFTIRAPHLVREAGVVIKTGWESVEIMSGRAYSIVELLRSPWREVVQHSFGVRVYDFLPRLAQMATPMEGATRLKEDGSNLPTIVRNLLQREQTRTKLQALIQTLLPYVETVQTARLPNDAAYLQVVERFAGQHTFSAPLLSDGTVHAIALIVALFFDARPNELAILEEPDRHLHPKIIERMMCLMRSASQERQILITTHNPELLRYTSVEELRLVKRDERGFSQIVYPASQKMARAFLRQRIDLPELHAKGLLGK
ncbi:MAG: AAA family ATPase [Fimbriimonadales bacterium]|nr:AAA family ATPase [Fimbriimonadales bacterium]